MSEQSRPAFMIVTAESARELEEKVNIAVAEYGYKPLGDHSIHLDEDEQEVWSISMGKAVADERMAQPGYKSATARGRF